MSKKTFRYIMATTFWFMFLGLIGLALWQSSIPHIPKLMFGALGCGVLCLAYIAEDGF